MLFATRPLRLLVIPGLHDSGPAHWQTWLEERVAGSLRVRQDDWARPDLDRWAARIGETMAAQPPARWVAAAHSFGCLALLRHLARGGRGIGAALLVAPADPDRFGNAGEMPGSAIAIPSAMLASETDPWMPYDRACSWARVWGTPLRCLGDAGHINAASGHGPLPLARELVEDMARSLRAGSESRRAPAHERAVAI